MIFVFMAGGPSHIETFDPKPLLNELSGQTQPAEFGEAKYQFVSRPRNCSGPSARSKNTARPASTCPICSRTWRRARTISRSFGRATEIRSFIRRRSTSCSAVESCRGRRAWAPGSRTGSGARRFAARLCRDAGSGWRAAGGAADVHRGFLPAIYQPTMFRPGPKPVLNLDLPPGISLAERGRRSI